MKKEVVFAIVVGFAVGLLITFGIYTAKTAIQQNQPEPSPTQPVLPDTQATSSAQLTITTPQHEDLFDKDTIPLRGQASPEAIISLITPAGQQIITADQDGHFETEIELEGGINEIKVSAFTQDGERVDQVFTVVFSTANIEP